MILQQTVMIAIHRVIVFLLQYLWMIILNENDDSKLAESVVPVAVVVDDG
jgi:hypothetical protein